MRATGLKKHGLLIIILSALVFPNVRADSLLINSLGSEPLLMTPSNTYNFMFSDIDSVAWTLTSSVSMPNSSGFYINSYSDVDALVSPPDLWTVRMYQTSNATEANLFAALGNTQSYTTTNPFGWSLNNGISNDMGGALQITMDAGTAQVSEIGINVVKDGTLFQKIYVFAVPEPSVTSLLLIGGIGLSIASKAFVRIKAKQ